MSLSGKSEIGIEIKASADKYHELFKYRPYHISNVSPDSIQACDLVEGEWGKVGAVLSWNYVLEGKNQVAKEKIIAIDDENRSIKFNKFEGDALKEYKSFEATIQVTPKGQGSVVHWILEYEKLSEEIEAPDAMLRFAVKVTKDIDAYLIT